MNNPSPLESIFFAALEKRSSAERTAFLDEACAANSELRASVERMLAAQAEAGSFLERPAPLPDETIDRPGREQSGAVIGPYKLLEQIGEGGMGVVYMAEQAKPVQRKVALKIIKPGMDSRQVIARFEAERQALAMMDHVNIARVLDAGATESGRPYFVMELVHGMPITKYCDDNHLTPRERLELFVPVCQAIQHAHQKGIIHRDIKPSNVMITLYDGKPVPKVIDFGVAKATEQKLTERTLFTQYGAMVGTLEYMSPEQAEMSALGADTRSDIYSLGVLLYELLTGSTPLSHKRVRAAAYAEVLSMIKEEEPPKPSTRLSDSGEALASISAQRHTEPSKLAKLMRGELDWIVMKTLEKDRNRRYETASAFASDVQRYLRDEPVLACPPSAWYRLRKIARRHKRAVLAASLVVLTLVGGIIGTTWGLIGAEQARQAEAGQRALADANEQRALQEARIAEAVRNFLQRDLLAQANPAEQADAVRRAGGGFDTTENPTIKELLDRAALELMPGKIEAKFPQQPEVQASILQTVGTTYWAIGEYASAVEFLTRSSNTYRRAFGANHSATLAALDYLGQAHHAAGKTAEAIALFEQVRDSRMKELGPEHPDTLTSLDNLAGAYHAAGRTAEATALYERVRDARLKTLGPDHPDTLTTLNNLAGMYHAAGKRVEAIALYERVREGRVKTLGPDHPLTLLTLQSLAGTYFFAGKTADAAALFDQVRDACVKKLGADHPITLATLHNLAQTYRAAGKTAEAIALYERVRDACVKKLGPDHPLTLAAMNNLAGAYLLGGKMAEAVALFEQVRDARVRKLGLEHPYTLVTLADLAVAYDAAGKREQALRLLQQAAVGIEKRQFAYPYAGQIIGTLSDFHERLGQYDQAEAWRRKWLVVVKERVGADSVPYADELALLGLNLLRQQKWPEAETVLRDSVAIRSKLQPDDWTMFNARSLLGGALLGQKKYADAEPLLLAGYEGMKRRAEKVPPQGKLRVVESMDRLVDLYAAWEKPVEAAKWRAERGRDSPKPTPPQEEPGP